MTNKKYEYEIQGKTYKLKKLTIGASLKFDKVQQIGINEETFPILLDAMFPNQGTENINWKNIDLEVWTKIQNDFFFVNKAVLDGQLNLVKNIVSMNQEPEKNQNLETSENNTG